MRWIYLTLGVVASVGCLAVAAFGLAGVAWSRASARVRGEMLAGSVAPRPVVAPRPAAEPVPPPVARLERLAFMQGCWRGPVGSAEGDFVEERHGPPAGGLMLGTVKYVRAGRPTQHEFLEIRAAADGAVSLLPYPGGRRSEHAFLLTSGDGAQAIFEAPEHDFPKRIVYRAVGPDGLEGSADAGAEDPSPRRWAMRRISCDEGGWAPVSAGHSFQRLRRGVCDTGLQTAETARRPTRC